MKKLKVKEVSEPALLTDMFPHSIPPHVVFDGTIKEHLPEHYKKAEEEGHLVYIHHEE